MSIENLSAEEYNMILEALSYRKKAFEEYQKYPDYAFKQARVNEVVDLIQKIKTSKKP